MRRSWARWLRAFSTSKTYKKSTFAIGIEALEERCMPSHLLLTVNSAGDDPSGPTPGVVTFRDAIKAVNNDSADDPNSPDVIQFAIAGTPTITLAKDLPALIHAATIDGSTQPGVTIVGKASSGADGGLGYQALVVSSAVTEKNVTFTDAQVTVNAGGNLGVTGDLTLGDSNGDYITVQNYGTLSVSGNLVGLDNTGLNNYGTAALNVTGNLTMGNYGFLFNGQSTADQSTCTVGGSLSINGVWGGVDNFGLSTMSVGGDLVVGDHGNVFNGADFDPADAAHLTVSGNLIGGTWSSVQNDGSSVLTVVHDFTLGSGGFLHNGESKTDVSSLTVGGNMSLGVTASNNSYIYNQGASVLQVTGNLTLLGTFTSLHNGFFASDTATCAVGGNLSMDVNSLVYDYGTLAVTGSFGMGADSFFADFRSMSVGGNFDPGSGSSASNDIIGGTLTTGPGSTITTNAATWNVLANGALINQGNFTVAGTLTSANRSIIVVEGHGQLSTQAGGQLNIQGTLLTWNNPADINQGTPLGGAQLDATATTMVGGLFVALAGTFVYAPASGTVLPVGQNQTLHVSFTPSDTTHYAAASAQVSVNVLQAQVTLTPILTMNPVNIVYGTPLADNQLSGTATVTVNNQTIYVGGTFSFTSAAGTILNAGNGQSEAVTFTPNDVIDYTTATATVMVNVAQADQTITVTMAAPSTAVYGTSFIVAATSSSGLAVAIQGSGAASASDAGAANVTMVSGTGTGTVTFSQAGNANYNAANVVIETVTAQKANQAISVTQAAPASAVYGASFTVAAVANSGLAVDISASGAASGSGSGSANVTMISGTGTGTVTFSQAGDANYNAASGVIETLSAQKADQTITVTQAAPASAVYSTSFTVSATASSGLAVQVSASGVASGSGSGSANITMTSGTGTATVTFSQAGDANYNAASVVMESVTAQKADQRITVTQAAPAAAVYDTSFAVAAMTTSGLSIDISASGVASGSGTDNATVTMTSGTGTGTVTFSQAGDANYNAASIVETVVAQKADQTITVTQAAPASAVYGTSFSVSAAASSGLAVDISAAGAAAGSGTGNATVSMTSGTGTGTVTFSQAGDSNYNAASVVIENVAAQKADQRITVTQAAPGIAVYGTSFAVAAMTTSGLSVDISASGVASGSGTDNATVTMTSGTGTATVTFTQAGDSNYNAASAVVESVTAQKADQTITVTQAAPASAIYGTSFTVAASASSGLSVGIAASGAASGSGSASASVIMSSGTGTGTVTFSQAGDNNYNAASGVIERVTAQKADQTITVTQTAPGSAVYGTSFVVAATASSGLAVQVSASGAASGSGAGNANVSMTSGTGTGTVTFSQAGDANYNAASVVVESVTAQKANQTITVTRPAPSSAFYGTSFTVSAAASSSLVVAIAASGVASGSGSGTADVTMTSGTGSGTVTFSQAGDSNYNAASVVIENVTAQKAAQTIMVTQTPPADAVYGGSFVVSATASSSLGVAISASGAAAGGGTGSATVNIVATTGTGTIAFSQAGNGNYASAVSTMTVTIIGPGVSVVGAELWYVCSSTSKAKNKVDIASAGSSGTGSTGIVVDGSTYTQSFTAIRIFLYDANSKVNIGNSLMISAFISGGNGNDTIQAGNNNNTINLGDGNDTVQVGDGSNVIMTGSGQNSIVAGSGNNLIAAGLGRHTVQVGNGSNIIIDGNVQLTQSGDSLRQVLDDWTLYGMSAANVASIRSRLAVTDNTSYANTLLAGSGLDWFWYTYAKDTTNRKATDLLN
jgi:hypothetical protein